MKQLVSLIKQSHFVVLDSAKPGASNAEKLGGGSHEERDAVLRFLRFLVEQSSTLRHLWKQGHFP